MALALAPLAMALQGLWRQAVVSGTKTLVTDPLDAVDFEVWPRWIELACLWVLHRITIWAGLVGSEQINKSSTPTSLGEPLVPMILSPVCSC